MSGELLHSIKRIAAAVGGVGVLVGAVFAVDERYVHADDFRRQVQLVRGELKDLHRARIEDEIFKLELIPPQKRTNAENAMLERYKNLMQQIDGHRRNL